MDDDMLVGLLQRAADPEMFDRFCRQGEACGWCANPVRLVGTATTVDRDSGEVFSRFDTDTEPDGVLLKACGSRRETRCPACAEVYRGDARHIIRAGLHGGKGTPETVSEHPAVFATFTAPSFGTVHGGSKSGARLCRPGARSTCAHGRTTCCFARHHPDDPVLGAPLCPDCFDYEGAVLWNAMASELWRRTTIAVPRMLAKLAGVPVRVIGDQVKVSFAKVVEYQKRGLVHVHAVFRLDGPDGGPPPEDFDAVRLSLAVRMAAAVTSASLSTEVSVRWGDQFDVRVVHADSECGVGRDAVANYIAKYASKSTSDTGGFDHRFRSAAEIDHRSASDHHRTMAKTAWRLGGECRFARLRLRAWAHDLGFRGHWLTKSHTWSTTFKQIRADRQRWRLDQVYARTPSTTSVVETRLGFVGMGWQTVGDALYADQRRQAAADARTLFREAHPYMAAA
jgi:hypothetical protein